MLWVLFSAWLIANGFIFVAGIIWIKIWTGYEWENGVRHGILLVLITEKVEHISEKYLHSYFWEQALKMVFVELFVMFYALTDISSSQWTSSSD